MMALTIKELRMDEPETYGGPIVSPNAPANKSTKQAAQLAVDDDSRPTPNYAHSCRLSGTPEELLIDFGRAKTRSACVERQVVPR